MERYLTKTEKIAAFREKYLPVWVILPLISIFVLNCLIYWGSGVLTADRYHFDFTMSLDRAVPLIPQFIWIYILAFPFGQWIIFWLHREEKMDFIGLWQLIWLFILHVLLFFWFCQLPMSDLRLQELHGPSRCLSLFISWMVETVRLTYFRQSIVM